MVIQSNMSPQAIIYVWKETAEVFNKYQIPITKQTLESIVEKEQIGSLLSDLNATVRSSTLTCIEGC